jgi:glucosamine 6-phosphate synthetase-like amidotransferase/phosphosugar isomerase protein
VARTQCVTRRSDDRIAGGLVDEAGLLRKYTNSTCSPTRHVPLGQGHLLTLPACGEMIAPIVFTVPLQLLAYHVAVLKGTDVDQPRNLAKSVTVE